MVEDFEAIFNAVRERKVSFAYSSAYLPFFREGEAPAEPEIPCKQGSAGASPSRMARLTYPDGRPLQKSHTKHLSPDPPNHPPKTYRIGHGGNANAKDEPPPNPPDAEIHGKRKHHTGAKADPPIRQSRDQGRDLHVRQAI